MMVPWLHISGKNVIDEFGNQVFLRGAAMSGLESFGYPRPAYWHGANFEAFITEPAKLGKKPNVIRIPCVLWEYWPWVTGATFEHDIALMEDAMDYAVNFAVENDIYVALDFHGVKDEQYHLIGEDPTLWINWMLHWVERYKHLPNVIYELWNEPWIEGFGDGDLALGRQRWISMVNRFCQEVTAVHPKALFIVAAEDVTVLDYWINNPLPYNVVYAFAYYYFHFDYDWYLKPYADGDYTLAYERVRNWFINYRRINAPIPLICKEFGWGSGLDVKEPAFDINMMHVFSLWTEFELHWYQWIWGTRSYGMANSDWTLRDPTGIIWAQSLNGSVLHTLTVESNVPGIPFTLERVK